jgi:hypothetical protein
MYLILYVISRWEQGNEFHRERVEEINAVQVYSEISKSLKPESTDEFHHALKGFGGLLMCCESDTQILFLGWPPLHLELPQGFALLYSSVGTYSFIIV